MRSKLKIIVNWLVCNKNILVAALVKNNKCLWLIICVPFSFNVKPYQDFKKDFKTCTESQAVLLQGPLCLSKVCLYIVNPLFSVETQRN